MEHADSPSLGNVHPSTEDLVLELTSGTKRTWPSSGQLSAATLSLKYAILYKIGIANWCPSTHGFGLSPALASLLYHIGTRSRLTMVSLFSTNFFDMLTPMLLNFLLASRACSLVFC